MNVVTQVADALAACADVSGSDDIVLDGKSFPITAEFRGISDADGLRVGFVDGGQADIFVTPSFSLHFLRMYGSVFEGMVRREECVSEFYLLVRTQDNHYVPELFPVRGEVAPVLARFHSFDPTLRVGMERADVVRVASAVRRFAELDVCTKLSCDTVVLDGTLDASLTGEQTLLDRLPSHVTAVAKTARIFTRRGRAASAVLSALGPATPWTYPVYQRGRQGISFVRLHSQSPYIFRFDTFGGCDVLPSLVAHSRDPVFLGYPYGLLWADSMARVSHTEADLLRTRLLARVGTVMNRQLNAVNAHDVLDAVSW